MQPALHVVRFKYSNRFHPSVEQIYRRTERDFPTVQINTYHIYSTIPSSNHGIRQEKMILKCTNIRSLWQCPHNANLRLRAGCLMGYGNKIFSPVSRNDVTRSPGGSLRNDDATPRTTPIKNQFMFYLRFLRYS